MSDLETVLIKLNCKKFKIFNSHGEFTKKGYNVYCNFCLALYDLDTILETKIHVEQVEKEMDYIASKD